METRADTLSCFGKVPSHGDFVRYNADPPAMRALDRWLQEGLYALKSRGGRNGELAYDQTGTFRFFFHPDRDAPVVAGALVPSRDRVGRRYPLVVAREVATVGDACLLPVTLAGFFSASADMATRLANGDLDHRSVDETLADGPASAMAIKGDHGYSHYLHSTTFLHLASNTWGNFEDARKYLFVKNLLDLSKKPARAPGMARPAVRFALSAEATEDGREPAFWLTACRLLLESDALSMSAFWSLPSNPSFPARMVVYPTSPAMTGFAALFAEAAMPDVVIDLQDARGESAVAAVLAVPPRLGEMLESAEIDLASFLDGLDAGSGSAPDDAVQA